MKSDELSVSVEETFSILMSGKEIDDIQRRIFFNQIQIMFALQEILKDLESKRDKRDWKQGWEGALPIK